MKKDQKYFHCWPYNGSCLLKGPVITKQSLRNRLIDLIYFQSQKKHDFSNIRYTINQSVVRDCLLDRQRRDCNDYRIVIVLEYSIAHRLIQRCLCLQ